MSVILLSCELKKNMKEIFNRKKNWTYVETDKSLTFIKKYHELDRFEITYNNVRNRLELCVPLNKSGVSYYCVIKHNMENIVTKYLEDYEEEFMN